MIKHMKNGIFRIMGIFVLLLGIRMIGEGIWNYIDEHNQTHWILTTAEVTNVTKEYSHSSTKHKHSVKYDITYQYEVNGNVYSDVLYNRGKSLELGDSIKIKYNPELPKDSTEILEPSLNNLIVFLMFGTVFSVLGVFISGLWALIGKMRNLRLKT